MNTSTIDSASPNALDDHNPDTTIRHGHGIRVDKQVSVEKTPQELYEFWHDFENLPKFMKHLESVTTTGDQTSHWIAKGPAGKTVEWDAEIINDIPNELIAWRSLDDADVPNAGSVSFKLSDLGYGTNVHVVLAYEPPAGVVGAAVAALFGEEPSHQVEEDLSRFKQFMESGTVPGTK